MIKPDLVRLNCYRSCFQKQLLDSSVVREVYKMNEYYLIGKESVDKHLYEATCAEQVSETVLACLPRCLCTTPIITSLSDWNNFFTSLDFDWDNDNVKAWSAQLADRRGSAVEHWA